ncbi:MAG TPA: hypothetical protein VLA92_02410 [Candidatus Saccharimonadales bacterium]|nr:hypothetical protein [Candidatus Saccharimonadales bacterium]
MTGETSPIESGSEGIVSHIPDLRGIPLADIENVPGVEEYQERLLKEVLEDPSGGIITD